MIPDKIYIPQNISRSDVISLSFPDDKGRGIEFIRKDALLEWAKETYLSENASAIRKVCFKQLVEKLNEM